MANAVSIHQVNHIVCNFFYCVVSQFRVICAVHFLSVKKTKKPCLFLIAYQFSYFKLGIFCALFCCVNPVLRKKETIRQNDGGRWYSWCNKKVGYTKSIQPFRYDANSIFIIIFNWKNTFFYIFSLAFVFDMCSSMLILLAQAQCQKTNSWW